MTIYKLSPSDLTFTWDECKYCFYMKVKHGIAARGPFPSIFGKMANLTSAFYDGKMAKEISAELDPGVLKYREKFVKSAPITLPGTASQCYIHGRFDAVIEFIDGSYGIVDYKTSDAKEEQVAFYSRQLTAYAWALEHPADGALHLTPVSRMGLFVITPERFERDVNGELVFINRTTWLDVPRDDAAFLALLQVIVAVLDEPEPPQPSEGCGLCIYREQMKGFKPDSTRSFEK